jgi:hypothetical protein
MIRIAIAFIFALPFIFMMISAGEKIIQDLKKNKK